MQNITTINQLKIPILGMGTWGIGGERTPDYSQDEFQIDLIQKAIELGYTHIDTAEIYGAGHAEELIGTSIKQLNRSNLFITSKVARAHCRYNDVLHAMDRSLKRISSSYFDLYLIHAPSADVPIEETIKAMDRLMDEGKTRMIGVSNFSVEQLKKAQACSNHKIVTNQIEYNLLVRNKGEYSHNMEAEVIPYCQKHDILITAHRPLAKGILTQPDLPLLKELSLKYKKSFAQISLNWLIRKKDMITIPKPSCVNHLTENLGALGWVLEENDSIRLDNLYNPTN